MSEASDLEDEIFNQILNSLDTEKEQDPEDDARSRKPKIPKKYVSLEEEAEDQLKEEARDRLLRADKERQAALTAEYQFQQYKATKNKDGMKEASANFYAVKGSGSQKKVAKKYIQLRKMKKKASDYKDAQKMGPGDD